MEARALRAAAQVPPNNRGTTANPVPERWVPERILRGHLAGASLAADGASSGEGVVLTGPDVPGGP
ncbi:MAG: hypothetical protein ACRDRA_08840, partial [Pseudonocardiaceae bacterium]